MISAFLKTHRLVVFPTGAYVMVKDPVATPRGTYVLQNNLKQMLSRKYAPEQIKPRYPVAGYSLPKKLIIS
ncbi:hypothetical protein BGZ96_003227, partial [Linnemannia gamsii]